MKVFFSWSGLRSKAVAEALSSFVSQVIQAVEPWLSQDIAKGARWNAEIDAQLEQSRIGITCLTPENLEAPWILFEAGAISKTRDAQLCTFLFDLKPIDVEEPLAKFQHTVPEKEDVRNLLRAINDAVRVAGEKALTDAALNKAFDMCWSEFSSALEGARSVAPSPKERPRSDRELLEEILEIVRRRNNADLAATWLESTSDPIFGTEAEPNPNKVARYALLATYVAQWRKLLEQDKEKKGGD